jgi:hypothetical protein
VDSEGFDGWIGLVLEQDGRPLIYFPAGIPASIDGRRGRSRPPTGPKPRSPRRWMTADRPMNRATGYRPRQGTSCDFFLSPPLSRPRRIFRMTLVIAEALSATNGVDRGPSLLIRDGRRLRR